MKFRLFFIPAVALAAAVLLGDCASPEPPAEVKKPDKLRPSLIYNIDSVKAFVQANKGVDTTAAQELGKAMKLITSSPEKAVYHLKNSIATKPTKDAYIQLGMLLGQSNEYTEAGSVYKLIAEVFPDFDPKLHYDMICVSLLDPANGSLYPYYDMALKAGISKEEIRSYLLSDKRLEQFRKTPKFSLLLEYLAPPLDKDEKHNYYRFTNEFKGDVEWDMNTGESTSRLPLIVGLKELQDFKPEESSRIRGYWDYIPEYKEKHDYVGFQPVMSLYVDVDAYENGRLLLYAIDTSAFGAKPEMKTVFYRLVWADYKGIERDSRIIAKHVGEEVSTLKVTSPEEYKFVFEVQHYKRTFKKPFDHKNNNNEVVEMKPLHKEIITASEKGKLVSRKK